MKMETPLVASAVTTALVLYVLRGHPSSTQIGLSVAVGVGTYYAMNQTPEENKTVKHVDIDQPQTVPTKICNIQVKYMHV